MITLKIILIILFTINCFGLSKWFLKTDNSETFKYNILNKYFVNLLKSYILQYYSFYFIPLLYLKYYKIEFDNKSIIDNCIQSLPAIIFFISNFYSTQNSV